MHNSNCLTLRACLSVARCRSRRVICLLSIVQTRHLCQTLRALLQDGSRQWKVAIYLNFLWRVMRFVLLKHVLQSAKLLKRGEPKSSSVRKLSGMVQKAQDIDVQMFRFMELCAHQCGSEDSIVDGLKPTNPTGFVPYPTGFGYRLYWNETFLFFRVPFVLRRNVFVSF